MDPLDMLIADGWEAVLEKLYCPLDKLNLVQCCSQLEDVFEEKISLWKSAAVLKIMLDLDKKWQRDGKDRIPDRDLLNFRLVNKIWCSVTDNAIGGYFSLFDFSTREIVEKFVDDFSVNSIIHQSIISKDVYLSCTKSDRNVNTDDDYPSLKQIIELLSRIGHVLEDVNIEVEELQNFEESGEIVNNLLNTLNHAASKVEVVCIDFKLQNYRHHHDLPQFQNNKNENEEWANPLLPHLKQLSIQHETRPRYSGPPFSIPSFLSCPDLSYLFGNLEALVLSLALWKEEYNRKGLFPRLKELCLYADGIDDEVVEKKVFNLFWTLDAPSLSMTWLSFGKDFRNSKQAYFCQRIMSLSLGDNWIASIQDRPHWRFELELKDE